jgi:hypothetical protein
VAGRVDSFLPFFPFSRDEAAVIHHKFLRSLSDQIRLPIDLHNKPPHPVGHLHLSLVKDGDLCKLLSENHYVRDLGARSIHNCVDGLADELFMLYTASEDEITEATNAKPHVKYSMQLHPIQCGTQSIQYNSASWNCIALPQRDIELHWIELGVVSIALDYELPIRAKTADRTWYG